MILNASPIAVAGLAVEPYRWLQQSAGFASAVDVDARSASWPGSTEFAVIDGSGALVTDVTIPWTWDNLPPSWDLWRGWSGQIAHIFTADLGAIRTAWVRVVAAAAAGVVPIVERQSSDDGVTWTDLFEVPPFGTPTLFRARHIRLRTTVPSESASLTAARLQIYQRR